MSINLRIYEPEDRDDHDQPADADAPSSLAPVPNWRQIVIRWVLWVLPAVFWTAVLIVVLRAGCSQ